MKKIWLARIALLPLVALAEGCSSTTSDDGNVPMVASALARDTSPSVTETDLAALRDGNTRFATDLYGALGHDPANAQKSLFVSPHSISIALAMIYGGARGRTATEMASALHFTLPPERLHAAFDALDLALTTGRTASDGSTPLSLRVVNSMWGAPRTSFQKPYLDLLMVDYGASVRLTDFGADPEGSRQRINRWVDHETEAKIPELIPAHALDETTRLVLVNAVYFRGTWATKFAKQATRSEIFHGAAGDVPTPMMHAELAASYGEGEGWRAVELAYDGALTFTAMVPDDLAKFEASFDDAKLRSVANAMKRANVTLALPKFSLEGASISLRELLADQGMREAFGEAADFSAIAPEPIHVADVFHQAFVAVDEDGTEATAATAATASVMAVEETTSKVVLTLDRPFVFVIRDIPTGAILFTGRYVGG